MAPGYDAGAVCPVRSVYAPSVPVGIAEENSVMMDTNNGVSQAQRLGVGAAGPVQEDCCPRCVHEPYPAVSICGSHGLGTCTVKPNIAYAAVPQTAGSC